MNEKKIINDPIHGFISIPTKLIFKVINHPYFQRLRRIKQLGLTDLVYPGALHTRFHHALGAMHLMNTALEVLKSKGHKISAKEKQAALLAILLHDIGHGPFSHALEHSILSNIHHEKLSLLIMEQLNIQFKGKLTLAIEMFCNRYERKFFYQLISSQLDMDRLDYLQRDAFFTGVKEGKIALNRIIRMLDLHQGKIVIEEKGIYSIENFLNTRRLMYWQVYLHKTSVSAEQMLIQVVRRAKELTQKGADIFATPSLKLFFDKNVTLSSIKQTPQYLDAFSQLDDYDVWTSIKIWTTHQDKVLSILSNMLLQRDLFRAELTNEPPSALLIETYIDRISKHFGLTKIEADYFCLTGNVTNAAYLPNTQLINIKTQKGKIKDIAKASDLPNIEALSKIVTKYYLCYPKIVSL